MTAIPPEVERVLSVYRAWAKGQEEARSARPRLLLAMDEHVFKDRRKL